MSKRCFDLLDLPCMSAIEVVAGKNGLSNKIFWVHIAESATDIDNLFDWLKPDDFLIIVGNFIRDHRDVLYEITKRAVAIKLSGILLYKSDYCLYPPQYMIDMAEKNDLPVFFLRDMQVSAIEIQYHMDSMILHDEDEDLYEKIIKDIYYGLLENADMKIQRANFLGYDLDRCHCGMTIELYDEEGAAPVAFGRRRADICMLHLKEYTGGPVLSYCYDNVFFCLLPRSERTNEPVKKLAALIRADLLRGDPGIRLLIGIGQGKNDVSQFKESINESMEIIRVMRLHNDWNTAKSYCDMFAYILIYHMRGSEIAKGLYHRLFDELIRYDMMHGSDLKDVLRIYLKEGKNISQTAKTLFLHRNTLLYKLKKIEELTQMSLAESESDFQFIMGFYLEDYIRSDGSQDEKTTNSINNR